MRLKFRQWSVSRRVGLLAVLLLAAGPCGVLARLLDSGRTMLPVESRRIATREFETARAANARAWSPITMAVAESLLQLAVTKDDRLRRRFWLLRNSTEVRDAFRAAARSLEQASAEALERQLESAHRADARLLQAARMVGIARACADLVPLAEEERASTARAGLFLRQASIDFRAGAHEEAWHLAVQAESLAADVSGACVTRMSRYSDARSVAAWQGMADGTVDWSAQTGGSAILIRKASHQLTFYTGGVPEWSCSIDIGTNNLEDKRRRGDRATPEGRYRVVALKGTGASMYHKAMLLDYPNPNDQVRLAGLAAESTANGSDPGGAIEIHGDGGRGRDWTDGCVALSNADLDWLFERIEVGTPVTIVGSTGEGGAFARLAERYHTAQRIMAR